MCNKWSTDFIAFRAISLLLGVCFSSEEEEKEEEKTECMTNKSVGEFRHTFSGEVTSGCGRRMQENSGDGSGDRIAPSECFCYSL